MSFMSNYPVLRLAVLSGLVALKEQIEADDEFLDSPDCPYDPETVTILKRLLAPKVVEKIVEKEVQVEAKAGRGRPSKETKLSPEDNDRIRKEIIKLIDALDDMGTGEGLPTNERIQITKTKTSLVKDILAMRERETTARKMDEFKEVVMRILDDLIDEKGRETFLKRLEPYR